MENNDIKVFDALTSTIDFASLQEALTKSIRDILEQNIKTELTVEKATELEQILSKRDMSLDDLLDKASVKVCTEFGLKCFIDNVAQSFITNSEEDKFVAKVGDKILFTHNETKEDKVVLVKGLVTFSLEPSHTTNESLH